MTQKKKVAAEKGAGESAVLDLKTPPPAEVPVVEVVEDEEEDGIALLNHAFEVLNKKHDKHQKQLAASREETSRLLELMQSYGETVEETLEKYLDQAFPKPASAAKRPGRPAGRPKSSNGSGGGSRAGRKPDGITSRQLVENFLKSRPGRQAPLSEIQAHFTENDRSQPGPTLSQMTKDGDVEAIARGVYRWSGK